MKEHYHTEQLYVKEIKDSTGIILESYCLSCGKIVYKVDMDWNK